jgi:hypothetical protein
MNVAFEVLKVAFRVIWAIVGSFVFDELVNSKHKQGS